MLDLRNLSFAYNASRPDAIQALQGVTLQIAPGEMVAIIGHNGSGKSTLAKVLAGVMPPTGGGFSVDGVEASEATTWEIRRRVGLVFQRPDDQLVANTVIDDVAFGPENLGLPREEIERRVAACLAALGLADRAHAQISELSGGEKQRVAIAGVLAMQPSYVILDEPTTMIAPAQARQVLALAHELRDRSGVAVLHITHFMHEVVGFDRIVVMDGGRMLMQGPPRQVFARADELRAVGLAVPQVTEVAQRLRARGVDLPPAVLTVEELAEALAAQAERSTKDEGRGLDSSAIADQAAPDETIPHSSSGLRPSSNSTPPLFEARGLTFSYMDGTPLAEEALRGVDCTVAAGETVAVLGGTQAGKSTLIEFFAGLRRPQPGQLFVEGRDAGAKGFSLDALRRWVGIVFQQPESQLFEEIVGKDVSFAPRLKGLAPAQSRAIVERVLGEVGLDYETYRLRYIYALSGGQKRRVAIAGALAAEPRVLILDEPVAGLDPRGRAELATLIADLARRTQLTVLLVGNTIDELAELADRALVMRQGRVVMEGDLRSLMRRAPELHALGLELSEAAEAALVLRKVFPELPTNLLHAEDLEAALLAVLGLPADVPIEDAAGMSEAGAQRLPLPADEASHGD
jgi:energy-coupling factor transport system ATP-binding protein